jgi:hypothetical protein
MLPAGVAHFKKYTALFGPSLTENGDAGGETFKGQMRS